MNYFKKFLILDANMTFFILLILHLLIIEFSQETSSKSLVGTALSQSLPNVSVSDENIDAWYYLKNRSQGDNTASKKTKVKLSKYLKIKMNEIFIEMIYDYQRNRR